MTTGGNSLLWVPRIRIRQILCRGFRESRYIRLVSYVVGAAKAGNIIGQPDTQSKQDNQFLHFSHYTIVIAASLSIGFLPLCADASLF